MKQDHLLKVRSRLGKKGPPAVGCAVSKGIRGTHEVDEFGAVDRAARVAINRVKQLVHHCLRHILAQER